MIKKDLTIRMPVCRQETPGGPCLRTEGHEGECDPAHWRTSVVQDNKVTKTGKRSRA